MTATSDRDLQLVIDSIPAMAWSARADGTGEFFNRRYLDYVGLSLAQVRDWQWASAIHPDDIDAVTAAWEKVRDAPAATEVEVRMRRHDGIYRWFSFRANPVCDANGNVVKWYGINVDIDEQKRAALILEGERQLLELIAHSRPLDEVLGVLCQAIERTLPGCHCEVRVADTSVTFFDHALAPSLPPKFLATVLGARLESDRSPSGMAATSRMQVIAEDIETDARWLGSPIRAQLLTHGLRSAWSTPIFSKSGSVLGTLCMYRREPSRPPAEHQEAVARATRMAGIAIERLRIELELRRRQYLLESAERISETGSFYWDMTNNKLVWSTQMYRIHELDEHLEPVYPNLLATIHPDDVQMINERTKRSFGGEGSPDGGYRIVMPDGRIKYLSTAYQVVTHEDGRRESYGVAQDVTRRRLAEDALDKVRSELAHVTRVMSLGELAASITHEVNQPLSGIVTNASTCLRMLAGNSPNVEGAIRTAQRTIRDANRASEVIKRLRGLYRKQDFALEPLNLNEAAREVVAICSHDLQRRRVAVELSLDPALPSVVGDRIQLQQVILNLLLNAADALGAVDDRPRQIVIATVETSPGMAQLTVRDTGSGIADEDLDKIFDAFYTTKPNGMGIGLSVSKSILDRHDGKLWASAGEEAGATFSFSLPCSPGA